MKIYIIMSLLIIVFGGLEKKNRIAKLKNFDKCDRIKTNVFYIVLLSIFLIIGGFRYYVGTDFGAYYKISPKSLNDVWIRLFSFDEPGMTFLAYVGRLIWDEGIFLIFLENAIITLLVFKGLKAYKLSDYTIALLLYLFYCGWLFSLNGVRQAIAISIIFAYSNIDKKNRILKYIFIVCLASLFHKSAIFMFPILIVANRKIDFKQIFLIFCLVMLIPYLGDFALNYMGVSNLAGEYVTEEINPIRIMVAFAPLLLIFLLYVKKHYDFFEKNYFAINMTIINAFLTLFTASSAYMNRFSRFTVLYTMILIPRFTERLTSTSKRIFNLIVMVLYFCYFAYEINSSGNYLPFQWSFKHFGEF